MAASATTPVLLAIAGLLRASPTLAAAVGTRVYIRPPKSPVTPYITIFDATGRDWSTSDTYGQELVIDVHVWASNVADPTQDLARTYLDAVYTALHDARPSVSGHNLILLRVQQTRHLSDPVDHNITHGVATVRALVGHG